MVRTRDSVGSNVSFEILSQRLAGAEAKLRDMENSMSKLNMGNMQQITKASPSIPFKVSEEGTSEGIFIRVSVVIPSNCGKVRVVIINKFQNTLQVGESTADGTARAKPKAKSFTLKVSDAERAANLCIQEIGPLQVKNNDEKNKYQLLRLEAKTKGEDSISFNPVADPFATFPFQVFKVRNDGANDSENEFFTIGNSVIGKKPSKPALELIVKNQVNLETQAADATLGFQVFAAVDVDGNPDMTTTFDDLDIEQVFIGLREFDGTPDADGDSDSPNRPGGPVADKSKPFTIIETVLPLAKRMLWTRNITLNGAGKQVNTPSTPVSFYAGGDPPTAGIPELSPGSFPMGGDFTITVFQQDNGHSLIQVTVKQRPAPARALLFKRLIITKTLPSEVKREPIKIPLLDEESVFVQGATVIFVREIQHKANKQGIIFGATIFGVNHTPAVPIKRDAANVMGDSTFTVAPSAPAANLVTTTPDSDTDDGTDSFADFTVFASATDPTKTFADTGADTVFIVLRKNNSANDDDPTDNRIPKYPFPIEAEDLTRTSIICRVRGLRTGKQYTWQRNLISRAGINIKSPSGTVNFRAGQMVANPALVGVSFTITQEGKRNALIRVTLTQPNPAVFLRSLKVLRDKRDGLGFREDANGKVILKDVTNAQIPGTSQYDIRVHVVPGATVDFRIRLTAVGGAFTDTATQTLTAGTGEAPTTLPSVPTAADIISNLIGELTSGNALTTFRVFASWTRDTGGQGGTGPGGSISFQDVFADTAQVILREPADAITNERFPFSKIIPDLTANFVDITASLAVGKRYVYSRNITLRGGTPARSNAASIQFTAGGAIATNGIPELQTVSLILRQVLDGNNQIDNRQIDAELNFTQPALSPVLLNAIRFQRKRSTDAQFKTIRTETILDDLSYQTGGVKQVTAALQVPANGTYNIRAIIIGRGNTPTTPIQRIVDANPQIQPPDTGNTDTARPQWGGFPAPGQSTLSNVVPNLFAKYRGSGIKVKCDRPDKFVKSLKVARVLIKFVAQVSGPPLPIMNNYFFNPETEAFTTFPPFFINTGGSESILMFDPNFYIDTGLGVNVLFSVDRPSITGPQGSATYSSNIGLPDPIANDLLLAYNNFWEAYMEIEVYYINLFNPASEPASAIGARSTRINFPFVNANGRPIIGQTASTFTVL